jgi:large subunit ribosomal protein L21
MAAKVPLLTWGGPSYAGGRTPIDDGKVYFMYAVVMLQGHQFRVEPDALVQVPRLQAAVGTKVPIEEVLLVADGGVTVGAPHVPGAKVTAEVVRHLRGPKVAGLKYKKRKDYRRRWGQRSELTELRIQSIQAGK